MELEILEDKKKRLGLASSFSKKPEVIKMNMKFSGESQKIRKPVQGGKPCSRYNGPLSPNSKSHGGF